MKSKFILFLPGYLKAQYRFGSSVQGLGLHELVAGSSAEITL